MKTPYMLLCADNYRGGMIVWRTALWYPDLISHVFSVCTPYIPPSERYNSLEDVVKKLPNFAYQKQFAGPVIESSIRTREEIKSFLNAIYGGQTAQGEQAMMAEKGVLIEKLPKLEPSKLVSDKVSTE